MSEKEKNILLKLSETVSKLDKDEQSYILGVTDGIVIAKNAKEAQEVAEKSPI